MSLPLYKTTENTISDAELSSEKFYKLVKIQMEEGFELEELRSILKNVPLDELILKERMKEREIWS